MPKYKGTIRKNDLEGGFWELHTDSGERYQLSGGDASLHHDGVRVEIDGHVDRNAFTFGMTAPVLKVKTHRRL